MHVIHLHNTSHVNTCDVIRPCLFFVSSIHTHRRFILAAKIDRLRPNCPQLQQPLRQFWSCPRGLKRSKNVSNFPGRFIGNVGLRLDFGHKEACLIMVHVQPQHVQDLIGIMQDARSPTFHHCMHHACVVLPRRPKFIMELRPPSVEAHHHRHKFQQPNVVVTSAKPLIHNHRWTRQCRVHKSVSALVIQQTPPCLPRPSMRSCAASCTHPPTSKSEAETRGTSSKIPMTSSPMSKACTPWWDHVSGP